MSEYNEQFGLVEGSLSKHLTLYVITAAMEDFEVDDRLMEMYSESNLHFQK
jgi:hypothetical protein